MVPEPPLTHAILEALADGEEHFIRDLAATLEVSAKKIADSGGHLVRNGYATRGLGVYRATEKGLAALKAGLRHGGKPGMSVERYRTSLRSRAWNLMRIKMWLSVDDMLMTLADGSEKSAERDLRRYVRALQKAGYVTCSTRNPQLFRLVNNTGRNAPAYNTKRETVTDTNTGEVHHV